MKRFINLRGQETGYNFAWWDTVIEEFEQHCGDFAFRDWSDFEEYYEGDDIDRYKRLCPQWVFDGIKPQWTREPPTEVGYYWAQLPDEIGIVTEPVQLSMNGDYHWVSVINGLATFSPSEVIKWGPRIAFPPLPNEGD